MNSKYAPYVITIIAIAGFIIRAMYWYPLLPDKVAIHFGFDGTPDNWSDKMDFIIIMGSVILFLVLVFFGLSMLVKALPDSMINLPNKEHWLASERRESTLDAVSQFLKDIGSRTLLFMAVIFEITSRTNASHSQHLDSQQFVVVLVMYLLLVVVAIVYFVRKFYNPEHPSTTT